MSNQNTGFSVLDMAKGYAAENDVDVADLFRKNPVSGNIKAESEASGTEVSAIGGDGTSGTGGSGASLGSINAVATERAVKKPWTPDAKLTEDMTEITSQPVTYSKDELVEDEPGELKNIADDNAIQSSRQAMDELGRKQANIQDAKKRFGIKHFQIPEGAFQVRVYAAAGDTNYKRSKEKLDVLFQEIVTTFPEFVLEWEDPSKNPYNIHQNNIPQAAPEQGGAKIPGMEEMEAAAADRKNYTNCNFDSKGNHVPSKTNVGDGTTPSLTADDGVDAKVVINKEQLPEISWTKEEMDVIKKSRSIELNIVEDVELKYTNIEDLDDNAVDVVLSQYQRKVNDVFGALPASKYRATFTGLTYTEILDLSHSQELNNLDGERKKWAIAFDHIKNQSIGPWQEYKWYIDPVTKQKVTIDINDTDPNIPNIVVRKHSKFDDFLTKTSYMDLEFILWKILCASSMDKEIISIDCHANNNGVKCNKSYDWIYSPNELLLTSSIDPVVLEEMKKTAEVNSIDQIKANYKESMLNTNNTIELPSSKFSIVFGHISAYEYLNSIYAEIHSLEDDENVLVSEAISRTMLTVIKSFLIPKATGSYSRVKGINGITKIINTLDEIDFQTVSELMRIMIQPYQFRYALRDICCPQCKSKSSIAIESMTRLLFIIAQSLSNVQVVLKRT